MADYSSAQSIPGLTLSGSSLSFTVTDSATNTTTNLLTLTHNTSGTPAASFGTGILFVGQDASKTAGGDQMAQISTSWSTATEASEASQIIFALRAGGAALATKFTFAGTGTFSPASNIILSGTTWIGNSDSNSQNAYRPGDHSLSSTTDFTINIDSDNGATTNKFIISHDTSIAGGTTVFEVGELGDCTIGIQAANATTDTTGYLYIPTCAGTPTGVPVGRTGKVAIIYDTTNNKVYVYNAAWKRAQVAAVDAIYA